MKKILPFIFLLLSFLTAASLTAQVSFKAKVSPNVVGRGEVLQLDLVVENGNKIERIVPPALSNFVVVGGPNQSTGYQANNGVTTSSFTLSYILQPRSTGRFEIGPATAIIDGKNYSSNTVPVKVVKEATGNSPSSGFVDPFAGMPNPFDQPRQETDYQDIILRSGEDPAEKIRKNLFIRVETNKNSCYVGEPVVVTYKLYTRLKSESKLVKNPSFNGFSVVDILLPNVNSYTKENYNGREYHVYTIRKAQLYPLQAGTLELESAEVENNVRFIREEYLRMLQQNSKDPFLRFSGADIPADARVEQNVTVKSNNASVNVRALPDAGKPDSFKGAVGDLSLSASLEDDHFTTDDAGRLVVAVTGSGNMQMITAPDIAWPKDFEVFEPRMTDDLAKGQVPIAGTKYFEYSFTADTPGTYKLPAVELSYFDPSSGTYKKAVSKPIAFSVIKGSGRPKDSVVVEQHDGEQFYNRLFSNRWWVAGPLIGLILAGLIIWLVRENRRAKTLRAATKAAADAEAAASIQKAEQLQAEHCNPLEASGLALIQQDSRLFYTTLLEELKQYLSKRFNIPLHELGRKALADHLDRKGIAITTVLELQELLDKLELQLYTPIADTADLQNVYDRALGIVEALRVA